MTEVVAVGLTTAAAAWGASGLATVGAMRERAGRLWTIWARTLALLGVIALACVIATLWITLDRPPMRTLGETRLWYAFLLPAVALLIEWRLKTTALRLPMLAFGILFVFINLNKPDALDHELMPALQSAWFVPHVVVYMIAYAALGLSAGVAGASLLRAVIARRPLDTPDLRLPLLLIQLGLPFLTLGLVFGAIWAKEAWGHYWTWDPKETWAFLTWCAYVAMVHVMRYRTMRPTAVLWMLVISFAVLLLCWFGLNHMPAAQQSVHSYTS
jgi:ABC-type transport system involved in cytochrome c biogenesis permease subunit